jgi:hypothetical protein
LKNKRNDIKKIIFGLSKGNTNVLNDYLAERKRRFDHAATNPDTEFIKLDEADIAEYCSSYNEDYKRLDPKGRDLVKMKYYLVKQEKKLTEMIP